MTTTTDIAKNHVASINDTGLGCRGENGARRR